jgi:HEPN domain-containing protein
VGVRHGTATAEKAVKTVLVARGIDFPRTHDVSRLVRLMPEGLLPEHDVEEFDRLSSWAVAGRYPADLRDAVRDDADRALDTARAVLGDVERILFPEEPERSRSPRSLSDRAPRRSAPGHASPASSSPAEDGSAPRSGRPTANAHP